MSEFISGRDALIELGNGRIIGYKKSHEHQIEWISSEDNYLHISDFFGNDFIFYLKPKTFMLNGIEVPAPFEPKYGEKFYYVDVRCGSGFNSITYRHDYKEYIQFGAWRTEEEIKLVVAELRKVFNPSN